MIVSSGAQKKGRLCSGLPESAVKSRVWQCPAVRDRGCERRGDEVCLPQLASPLCHETEDCNHGNAALHAYLPISCGSRGGTELWRSGAQRGGGAVAGSRVLGG